MQTPRYDEAKQVQFVLQLVAYAVTIVAVLMFDMVAIVQEQSTAAIVLANAVLVSVAGLGLRHLYRAVNPIPPVEMPARY